MRSMRKLPLSPLLPLSIASEAFGLSIAHIVNLGATGRIRLLAPVLNAGVFVWPTGPGAAAFPEMPRALKRRFGPADRVVISPSNLREIEAQGWSCVHTFVSTEAAQAALEDETWYQVFGARSKVISAKTGPGYAPIRYQVLTEGRGVDPDLQDLQLIAPWIPAEQYGSGGARTQGSSLRTTVDHLFADPRELRELLEPAENDVVEPHGNTLRNAQRREQVLAAALHLVYKHPGRYPDATALTTALFHNVDTLWPVEHDLPMTQRSISKLLGQAITRSR